MGILISANVAPAMKSMDQVGNKVKDVGQTSQKEGAKTEGFMKKWAGSFAAIGAAATASLYMVVKASPLLAGAMQEMQDAISLLFMTIGDALEPILRPFVDALWSLSDLITDMPAPLDALVAGFVAFGGSITAILAGLTLLPIALHAVGLAAGAAASPLLILSTAFFGIVTAAGLVAAALYHISEEPTVAIVGALTTIGVGATILMGNPLVLAVTSIISAFVLMTGEMGNMETLASAAFLAIGLAASALLLNPVIVAITAIVGGVALLITSSADFEIKMLAVFTAIGIAAAALLSNPFILAIVAIIDAVYLLILALKELEKMMGGQTIGGGVQVPSWFPVITPGVGEDPHAGWYQHGGYVPHTGPAFLHAGEYVVPAGRTGGGGGYTDNRVLHFDIHDNLLAGDMDVDRLKQRLDELYKIELGRVP